MTHHTLKSWPSFFECAWYGDKPFEVRSTADRIFRTGDTVELREWDQRVTVGYTGRVIRGVITFVMDGGPVQRALKYELPAGTCVFAYRVTSKEDRERAVSGGENHRCTQK